MRLGILTLTTDFGSDGPYVAAMKGVILGRAPGTQIVDVSHAISPQNMAEGAFVLASIFDAFPPGTVHLAVVDPGVGTDRRVIAVEVQKRWFVLPDNGLISEVLNGRDASEIREIKNPSLRLANVSTTFHGRDIMAPAAAHLLSGGDPARLGPRLDELIRLASIKPLETVDGLRGEVIFRDSFGNLITNITRENLASSPPSAWRLEILGQTILGVTRTYGDRPAGSLVALIGSSDRLEIAVVNGSAAEALRAGPGTPIQLFRTSEPLA